MSGYAGDHQTPSVRANSIFTPLISTFASWKFATSYETQSGWG